MSVGILLSCPDFQQAAIVCRRTLRPIIVVIPSRKVEDSSAGASVFVAEFAPVPPWIFSRMPQPVEIIRCDLLKRFQVKQRQGVQHRRPVRLPGGESLLVRSWAGQV